jgi:5-methylcytosine-specific restriction endonuclease McrA
MKDTSKLPPTPNNLCGKASGYNKHLRNGEYSCDSCKKAKQERDAKYRAKNVKKINKLAADYRAKNPEKLKEQQAKYRFENLEKNKKRHAKYHAQNSKKIKKQKAKKFFENPDKIKEQRRRKTHKRRATKFNNGFEVYTEQQVLDLYGIKCHICDVEIDLQAPRGIGKKGWEKGLHIDHLIPISKGGADTLENVRPSHGSCNLRKSNNIARQLP